MLRQAATFHCKKLTIKHVTVMLLCALVFRLSAEEIRKYNVYTESWAPFSYEFEKETIGIATDLVKDLLDRSGIEYQLTLVPWARGFNKVQTSPGTMLFLTKLTPDREHLFQWVGPIAEINLYLYQLKENPIIEIDDLRDLRRYRVGVERGGSSEKVLNQLGLDERGTLYPVNSFSQLIAMIFKDRIDFVISDEISLQFQTKMTGYPFKELMQNRIFSEQGQYYLALNIQTPQSVVSALQYHLEIMQQNGDDTKIIQRYIDDQ